MKRAMRVKNKQLKCRLTNFRFKINFYPFSFAFKGGKEGMNIELKRVRN